MAPSRTEELLKQKKAASEKERQLEFEVDETMLKVKLLQKEIKKTQDDAKSVGESSSRALQECQEFLHSSKSAMETINREI